GFADTVHRRAVEFLRHRPYRRHRHRRRRHRGPGAIGIAEWAAALPRNVGRALAAGMAELNPQLRLTEFAAGVDGALQRRFVGVVVKAETARRDAADTLHRRRLD